MTKTVPAIDFDRAIALIQEASKKGEDVWDVSVNLGVALVQAQDKDNYNIGDLAVTVQSDYGEDSIGKWSKDIGADVKRVKEYRTTCAYWQKEARNELLQAMPRVNYSLLRLTANRFASPKEAIAFLEECCDNDWSVERARLAIKELKGELLPPEKVADVHVNVTRVDHATGKMTVEFVGGVFPDVAEGLKARLVMYATKSKLGEGDV